MAPDPMLAEQLAGAGVAEWCGSRVELGGLVLAYGPPAM